MQKVKKVNNKLNITFGLLFLIVGIILVSSNYLNTKINLAYNKMNLSILAYQTANDKIVEEKIEPVEEITETEQVEANNNSNNQTTTNKTNYVAKISIPKISLDQGLIDIKSKYNNIKYNIQTLSGSDYPDVNNGNLILLSHSGTSSISYFKNLYKLSLKDQVYIEYKGLTYTYAIARIYNKPKTGTIAIERDSSKTTLTLITCTRNSKTEQTVYIAELVK